MELFKMFENFNVFLPLFFPPRTPYLEKRGN